MAAPTFAFRSIIDTPQWVGQANTLNAQAAASCVAFDQRQGPMRHPLIYHYVSATVLNAYNPLTDEWIFIGSPAMGTFAAGAGAVFVPSAGPSGTIASATSNTQFTLSTALPAAVGNNQLANRGDGTGFYIRVIQQATTGLIGEQPIVANTSGTTPVITVAASLGFTPAANDKYEILSGRVFLMATAASIWKYYDVATNSFSAALTTTNLTTPAIDNTMTVLDEQYTPLGKLPSTGFFGNLTATASTNVTNATLTGTAGAADASLAANEYANFQIRIIQDGTNPTAVGQRKKITSHTAATPTVYTLSGTWTVAPSATALYVVEAVGDIICMTGSAVALAHTYAAGGFRADGAWSTGATNGAVAALQIPARQANSAVGMEGVWAFGMAALDAQKVARYSTYYLIRGGAVNTIDALDIATLSWTTGTGGADIAYGNKGSLTFTTGTCGVYDNQTNSTMATSANYVNNDGWYWYINQNGGQRFYRFDVMNRVMLPYAYLRQPQGTATLGQRMALAWSVDTTYTGFLYVWGCTQSTWQRIMLSM